MQQRLLSVALAAAFASSAHAQSDAPGVADHNFPNAKPGECYAKVYVEPQYTTASRQMLKREAGTRVEVIPAKYGTDQEEVVVREASKRLEIVPAVYETVTEEVVVSEASKRIEVVRPAVYEDKLERVLVREAYTTWKPGHSNGLQKTGGKVLRESTSASGEIMCLVEVPGEYKTVTSRVLKAPPETRETEIPAVTRTITRTVMKAPPTTREVEVPEVTKTINVRKEIEPAKTLSVDVPAEYQTVTATKLVSQGRYEWRSILCDTNATPGKIRELQTALKDKGFNPGPIDGVLSTQTMAAVNRYQQANNLPVDPYVNMQTVQALGVAAR